MENIEKNAEAVTEVTEVTIERPYTLRKLKDGDLFPLLGLFRKLGLKEFKDVITSVASGGDAQGFSINDLLNVGDVMISHLEGDAGEAVYQFYSSLSGIPVEEMKEMEFGTLPMMIYDSFKEAKNANFFKVLARLL